MIKLRSKATGDVRTVTQEEFQQIVTQGDLHYYKILEREDNIPIPKSVIKEMDKSGNK